ncbi:MAG: type II toxin-antitoxin system VapC family toxin, partial [Verrucomicrobiota bacterium]
FLDRLVLLEWGASAARVHASLRIKLEQEGNRMALMDSLIAAHAIADDRILVTNNTKHFSRVHNLKLENWVQL